MTTSRPSGRQIAVYASALALVLLAEPRLVTFWIGSCLVASAWILRIWAFGHLEKNQWMVTTGPYAHTRNPAYLGSFLALLGVALAAGNWETTHGKLVWAFSLLLVAGFFLGYLPRKFAREYGRLEERFGELALRHAQNVPDFWPRLKPWRSGDPRRFSWRLVTDNHEWPWGVVLALVLVAVWFGPRWSPLHGILS
jgi:protein-S-isoprenylcysteine O-methyltransferase Ste14